MIITKKKGCGIIGQFTLISKLTVEYWKWWMKTCYVVSVQDRDNTYGYYILLINYKIKKYWRMRKLRLNIINTPTMKII